MSGANRSIFASYVFSEARVTALSTQSTVTSDCNIMESQEPVLPLTFIKHERTTPDNLGVIIRAMSSKVQDA